jgi:hypothetical protein
LWIEVLPKGQARRGGHDERAVEREREEKEMGRRGAAATALRGAEETILRRRGLEAEVEILARREDSCLDVMFAPSMGMLDYWIVSPELWSR